MANCRSLQQAPLISVAIALSKTLAGANIWERALRATVLASLLILPFSAAAQTPRDEKPYVSEFRACVRSHTTDAQAAGVRTENQAVDYAIKTCAPLFGVFLGSGSTSSPTSSTPAGDALPPGLFRVIVRQEWGDFIGQRDKQ
jgi:hypothetical protein